MQAVAVAFPIAAKTPYIVVNMIPSARDLYLSILHRAAEEWGVETTDDVERDIGQSFDPMVRFMAGATASELERVYQYIQGSEDRLMERITRVLLPEHFHLPKPSHALAKADPSSASFLASDSLELIFQPEDSSESIPFTPVFPVRLLPVRIRVVATESDVLELSPRPRLRRSAGSDVTEFRRLLIGFEAPAPVKDWSHVALWLDLTAEKHGLEERASLYKAMQEIQVSLQGTALHVSCGLPVGNMLLEDHLSGQYSMEAELHAWYDRQFLTFLDSEVPVMEPVSEEDYLGQWFGHDGPSKVKRSVSASDKAEGQERLLYWMELAFPRPLHVRNIGQRLRIHFNVFPVVNRRLCGAGKGEHHFLQTQTLKWIHLSPAEPFLSIRRVYREKPPENPSFLYKPFADFREDKSPSFTLRFGGLGRWDDLNAWRRLAHVVSLLQENYEHKELIDKAAESLTLEDIHLLLGRKADSVKEQHGTQDVYLLLQTGTIEGIRLRAEYWTSMGRRANRVQAGSRLTCTTAMAAVLETGSLELLSTSAGGEDPLDTSAKLHALRQVLLSRDRLVTREDVRSFCTAFLQDRVECLTIREGVGYDPMRPQGMSRRLEVWLRPAGDYVLEDWESVCHQLMQLIARKTSSVVPVWVGVDPNPIRPEA